MDASELCKILQNKQLQQQNTPPPLRFNLYNPYIGSAYTNYDLDMRRKTEILKYSSNISNSQTNNLTKKQLWALISKGSYKQLSQDQLNRAMMINNKVGVLKDCSLNSIIHTPTSSCDVPGPIITLYNDDSIPLYNYNENINNRSYGTTNNTIK